MNYINGTLLSLERKNPDYLNKEYRQIVRKNNLDRIEHYRGVPNVISHK